MSCSKPYTVIPAAAERSKLLAAVIAVAVAVGGCGSGNVAGVSGPAVFATHCATCHSLTGHSVAQQQGGDLRGLRLPRSELLQYSAEMPRVDGPLTERELAAVVSYVQSVERR